jgi:hypothetical protein
MAAYNEFHWHFGNNSHIEFTNGGEPVLRPDAQLVTWEGCASISDQSGSLLFYTDGQRLWDSNDNVVPVNFPISTASPLGGNQSSTHSAIVVPPAGTGSFYHIFTMSSLDMPSQLYHTTVSVSGSNVTVASGPSAVTGGPQSSSEYLAAVPHYNCKDFWVISLDVQDQNFYVFKVSDDTCPVPTMAQIVPFGFTTFGGYCCKASPSGTLLAFTTEDSICIYNFDRNSGAITQHSQIAGVFAFDSMDDMRGPYGIEFSPDEKYLYYTLLSGGTLHQHLVGSSTTHSATNVIWTRTPSNTSHVYQLGALQLGPNGKIYGSKYDTQELLVLETPNLSNPTFTAVATASDGSPLVLNGNVQLGLPTFTRISNDCIDKKCSEIENEVEAFLETSLKGHVNALTQCGQEKAIWPGVDQCKPLEIAKIEPTYHITFGASQCDCIESDDVEAMNFTICNPYSNITLSHLTLHRLQVLDGSGQPVALLPDGTPSVEIVPIGPHCFEDIGPCVCVTRQFTLRNRGAKQGPYKIIADGVCFDVCVHQDTSVCFTFEICKD